MSTGSFRRTRKPPAGRTPDAPSISTTSSQAGTAVPRGGPFQKGTPQQGSQSPLTPADQYRKGLADLNDHCKSKYGGKPFAQLPDEIKDAVLGELEKGSIQLRDQDAKAFFKHLVKDTREGFFADPIYGGNRDRFSRRTLRLPRLGFPPQ